MSAGFTPGPWRVTRNEYHSAFHGVASFHPRHICRVPEDDADDGIGDVGLSNAHLIAAAPELYEALADADLSEAIYAWANEKNIGREEYDRRSGKVEKLRSALAKARGEAQ